MRRRECGIAISPKLVTYAGIVESMSEGVWMVEHFGEGKRLREAVRCLLPGARQLQRVAALNMAANAGIVTAECVAEVTVTGHVVAFSTVPATFQPVCHLPSNKCPPPQPLVPF